MIQTVLPIVLGVDRLRVGAHPRLSKQRLQPVPREAGDVQQITQ